MKSALVLGLVLVSVPAGLVSQQPASSPRPATVGKATQPLDSTVSGCPVGMRVRQGVGSQLMAVQDGRQIEIPQARLVLTLSRLAPGPEESAQESTIPAASSRIVQAIVTVHGTSSQMRILPLASIPGGASSFSKTVEVHFDPTDPKDVSTQFLLPGFTSTSRVDLQSVTYADGSTWKIAGPVGCHAVPDPLMLISGR